VVYPGFIACYYASHKFQSICMNFRFSLDFLHQESFTFWSSILGHPSCTEFCHQQMFTQDHLNSTSAYAHTIGYQLHVDSMILQYSIFNSMTVLFTDSFLWTSHFIPFQ